MKRPGFDALVYSALETLDGVGTETGVTCDGSGVRLAESITDD